ncbi:MAG TPA: tyrosine-type recombinase/integrase [Gemmataceae bacterium]|nr:tyrosine-type recombinase/integrase [Gemmataceae bacterium]
MTKSTKPRRSRKAAERPKKPYPTFPLTPHASGAWQKKIRGKTHYFGRWANWVNGKLVRVDAEGGWKAALELYTAQADDLHAGRTPRVTADGLTVADLCNRFLTAKVRKVEAGELGQRMFTDYKEVTDLLTEAFGVNRLVEDLAADDFAVLRATMAKTWGPVRLGNGITRVKSVFKYGTDNGLIERAVRYGSEFRKPDKAVLRRHRAKAGPKMLEADQLRQLLDALDGKEVPTGRTAEGGKPETARQPANPSLRAMVLLGINCGFGNHDCATLSLASVELEKEWVNFPRPKTGIARRCALWPETVEALRAVIGARLTPKGYAEVGLVFLNSRGSPWVKVTSKSRTDNISVHFANALKLAGLHREGLGFYTLRHVFQTVADGARDPVAIGAIMGHADPSMAGHYRERIDDERLRAVSDHVRAWLFAGAGQIAG